jgi:hypothetical protein
MYCIKNTYNIHAAELGWDEEETRQVGKTKARKKRKNEKETKRNMYTAARISRWMRRTHGSREKINK